MDLANGTDSCESQCHVVLTSGDVSAVHLTSYSTNHATAAGKACVLELLPDLKNIFHLTSVSKDKCAVQKALTISSANSPHNWQKTNKNVYDRKMQ